MKYTQEQISELRRLIETKCKRTGGNSVQILFDESANKRLLAALILEIGIEVLDRLEKLEKESSHYKSTFFVLGGENDYLREENTKLKKQLNYINYPGGMP